MKNIFLTMIGAALMAAPAYAQTTGTQAAKIDVAKLRSSLAKSDGEIADAKKNTKAATWIKRGELMLDVDGKPTAGLYSGMPETMLTLTFGTAPASEETIGGEPHKVYTYEHFKAYMAPAGTVDFYVPTTVVDPQALDKAYEAYDKAYGMDAKAAKKVGEGMKNVRLRSFETGGTLYGLQDYKGASTNFRRAFNASVHPSAPSPDTLAIYYAGMSATYGGDYQAALTDLEKASALGYEANGDVDRLRFVSLYTLDRKEESLEVLKAAITKFPGNEDLVDMATRYYAENEGDPTSLIPLVQGAIDKNPGNSNLVLGLARVYDKLGQTDNAITTIKKAVALAPEDAVTNLLEGYFIIKKGDELNAAAGKQVFTSAAESQKAYDEANNFFRNAIAPLEKAHALDTTNPTAVELLKNITFRLREEPGMQAKYDTYNKLLSEMGAQ
jgi:tetratricopeptide (TPR) repeat protein